MMTLNDARAAIHGRVETFMNASYSTTKVQYTNHEGIDFASQQAPFLTCDIMWADGQQVDMAETPSKRRFGAVWLHVGTKAGKGTKDALLMLDALAKHLEIKTFGGVLTQAAQPMAGFDRAGWWYERVRVPFYFNDL